MESKLNVTGLYEAVRKIKKWKKDDSGVLMASMPSQGVDWLKNLPELTAAVHEIATLRGCVALNAMINIIPPGIKVPVHRDYLVPYLGNKYPILERWHLPILTNDLATWWDEHQATVDVKVAEGVTKQGVEQHMPVGVWAGPVKYWIQHTVKNLGKTERIHLVVDLAKIVPGEMYSTTEQL